jgi:hypothetical protein
VNLKRMMRALSSTSATPCNLSGYRNSSLNSGSSSLLVDKGSGMRSQLKQWPDRMSPHNASNAEIGRLIFDTDIGTGKVLSAGPSRQ